MQQLNAEMKNFTKKAVTVVEPKRTYSEAVMMKALAEVLGSLGWYDFEQFSNMVDLILNGPPRSVPFSYKTKNVQTGEMDFWLVRIFINISPDYEVEEVVYNKKEVLTSKQFSDFLRQYCREQLEDKVQFWTFTGTSSGNQHLDMTKLNRYDISLLQDTIGETNGENLVMIQFKKKLPFVKQ